LAVDLANRESRSSWRDFLEARRHVGCTAWSSSSPMIIRGLEDGDRRGVVRGVLAALLRAFLKKRARLCPRKVDDDCLLELRCMYDRRDLSEVRRDLAAWLRQVPQARPLVRGQHRGDLDLLPAPAGAT